MLALLTRSLGQRRPGAARYVRHTPMEAQAAGRIHPLKVCVTAAAVVNPGCALTDFNAEEAAGSLLSDAS